MMQGLSDKILPELVRVEIFPDNRKRLDLAAAYCPEITFAPATKMHTDACLEGGMETEAYTWRGERKKGTDGMAQRAIGDR